MYAHRHLSTAVACSWFCLAIFFFLDPNRIVMKWNLASWVGSTKPGWIWGRDEKARDATWEGLLVSLVLPMTVRMGKKDHWISGVVLRCRGLSQLLTSFPSVSHRVLESPTWTLIRDLLPSLLSILKGHTLLLLVGEGVCLLLWATNGLILSLYFTTGTLKAQKR